MKNVNKFCISLFGIIAVMAIIVGAFASCDSAPGHNDPVIPAEYQNKTWEHTDGYILTLAKDKVTITLTDGRTVTYPYTGVESINGNTVLRFETNSNVAGVITINNELIIGIVFPDLTKSGGWSKSSSNNTVYTFTNIDELTIWFMYQDWNDEQNPYHIKLNVNDITGLIKNMGTIYEYKHFTLDLSDCSATNIEANAFACCNYVISIKLPNSLVTIGNNAFDRCSKLTSIILPNSVTSIGEKAFTGCYSLTSIILPNSVTSIGQGAFYSCSSLTSINLPNNITSIGKEAFYDCSKLTSIILPNSVTSIGESVFSYCYSLTSVILPNNIVSIGRNAFSHTGLTSINLPDSITSIGIYAFSYTGLTSVTIPYGLTTIETGVFNNCFKLASIIIPSNITTIEYAAFSPALITSVTFQSSNISIDSNAFYGDLRLKYIEGKAGTYTRPDNSNTWTKM